MVFLQNNNRISPKSCNPLKNRIFAAQFIKPKTQEMAKLAVVAFGGNALLRSGQKGTYKEQIENVSQTCQSLLGLLKQDYNIVIGHGNGPQVGNVMLQHEAGSKAPARTGSRTGRKSGPPD